MGLGDLGPIPLLQHHELSVPRYFFNVYDDVGARDEEGVELPDEAAARLQALVGARDLMAAQVKRGYLARSHWIEVLDDHGEAHFTLTFGEAVNMDV